MGFALHGLLQAPLAERGSGCTSCGLDAWVRAQLEEKFEPGHTRRLAYRWRRVCQFRGALVRVGRQCAAGGLEDMPT